MGCEFGLIPAAATAIGHLAAKISSVPMTKISVKQEQPFDPSSQARPSPGVCPRIAFVISSLGAGGSERVIAQVSSAFAADGMDVTIIAFDRPEDPVFHRFDSRVRLIRLGLPPVRRRSAAVYAIIRRLVRLRRTLKEGEFDIAISFLTKINALTLGASAGMRLPVIVSERNNPLAQPQHAFWRVALKFLYPRSRAIVLQTEKSRICLPPRERDRAVVIRNPATQPTFEPNGANGKCVVGVGRLTEQKGFDLLIDAFARIAESNPEWQLLVWGEGPDRGSLEQQVRSCGLEGRIALPGTSPQPGSWVQDASLFVLSSRFEGSPNVMLEAMAAGIPIIATRCDFGPSEMLEDGKHGLLVSTEDPEALAEAMSRLMANADLRASLGAAGRRRAETEFDLDTIIEKWRSLVFSALGAATVLSGKANSRAAVSASS